MRVLDNGIEIRLDSLYIPDDFKKYENTLLFDEGDLIAQAVFKVTKDGSCKDVIIDLLIQGSPLVYFNDEDYTSAFDYPPELIKAITEKDTDKFEVEENTIIEICSNVDLFDRDNEQDKWLETLPDTRKGVLHLFYETMSDCAENIF